MTKKKKRIEHIYGTTASDVTEISVTYDPPTDEMSFGQPMTNTYSEVSYDRAKGPKIISRVPQAHSNLTFSASEALKKNYDFCCAVDTNTRNIQGRQVSATGVVVFKHISIPGPKGIDKFWKYGVPFCIEIVGAKAPPENLGWIVALEQLLMRGMTQPTTKIGMVVDSDLGNLKSYNERKKPLFGNVMLHSNTTLLYASSDVTNESIVNKVLSVADSAASQTLAAIENGLIPFNTATGQSSWFEAIRPVEANNVETRSI